MNSTREIIIYGTVTGWLVYIILIVFFQLRLESAISNVQVFKKIFDNDPAISATVKYSINEDLFEETKRLEYRDFNVLTWRVLQNLEVINSETLPNEISPQINNSLGQLIRKNNLNELRSMTGLELLYEIQSYAGNSPSRDDHKEVTLEYIEGIIANSPMDMRDYSTHVQQCENTNECESQDSYFKTILAYIFPPEISASWWTEGSLNEFLELSYAHIGVSEEFKTIGTGGEIDQLTFYNQYNDLLLKILISIYNDEVVSRRRDMVMVFKGFVQMLIIVTFCTTMFVIAKMDFTTEENDRLLDLLKTLLPTLGFIGTIYGLMKSLGEAYKIPIASGDANTSLAISEITSSLSIAFTTTLLAFILLVVVDIFRIYKLQKR